MMDASLPLEWVCCPLSGQRLEVADAALLLRLEAERVAGKLRFLQEPAAVQIDLAQPLEAGLVRQDGQVFYAVTGGVPVLLPDHAICIADIA